jgi:CubicO group peptidase (beta-lactamase class C family)
MYKFLFFFLLLITNTSFAKNSSKIEELVHQEMANNNIPAIAVSVISSGKVTYMSAIGLSDIENKNVATIDTPFHIASVSKTVTSMAVFHLIQAGKIQLNDNINKYLPFTITNPHHPEDKITIAELLNHLSGILDNEEFYLPFWVTPKGDPINNLQTFLKDYLVQDGQSFSNSHFESADKYKVYDYSNTGYALLGLIIEQVSGEKFESYLMNKIFEPNGMENSSFFLKNLNIERVSKTYTLVDDKLTFKGFNGYPDYPAGQLRTSIADYTKLIAGYLNADKKPFVLSHKITSLITPLVNDNLEDHSYTWFLRKINDNWYYQHGGADLGARAEAIIDVKNDNAIIIFTNSGFDLSSLMQKIESSAFNN